MLILPVLWAQVMTVMTVMTALLEQLGRRRIPILVRPRRGLFFTPCKGRRVEYRLRWALGPRRSWAREPATDRLSDKGRPFRAESERSLGGDDSSMPMSRACGARRFGSGSGRITRPASEPAPPAASRPSDSAQSAEAIGCALFEQGGAAGEQEEVVFPQVPDRPTDSAVSEDAAPTRKSRLFTTVHPRVSVHGPRSYPVQFCPFHGTSHASRRRMAKEKANAQAAMIPMPTKTTSVARKCDADMIR